MLQAAICLGSPVVTPTRRDGHTASDVPGQCCVRANGSPVRWWLQSNPSALNLIAHLILKILLEKACLGSLQHTTPLNYTNCLGSSKLPFAVLCPETPSPAGCARAVHGLGWTHTFGLCTHHKASASDLQVPDLWCRQRMLLSAWCGRRRGARRARTGHSRGSQGGRAFHLLPVTINTYILGSKC